MDIHVRRGHGVCLMTAVFVSGKALAAGFAGELPAASGQLIYS